MNAGDHVWRHSTSPFRIFWLRLLIIRETLVIKLRWNENQKCHRSSRTRVAIPWFRHSFVPKMASAGLTVDCTVLCNVLSWTTLLDDLHSNPKVCSSRYEKIIFTSEPSVTGCLAVNKCCFQGEHYPGPSATWPGSVIF